MLEYIIRYDGIQVNRGGLWTIYDDLLEQEAGTFGSYSFTIAPTHPMAKPETFATENPAHEVTFSERYADGKEAELFRGWVKKTSMDTDLMLTVECEGMLSYLQNTVVRPYACRSMSDLPDGTELITGDPFEYLIDQHNAHCPGTMQFSIGFNPRVGEVSAGTSWNSTWEELNDKFCTGLDRYLYARSGAGGKRFVDLLDGGVGEGTQTIVLSENIVSMDISGESSEIVTAIIPRATLDDDYNEARGMKVDQREIGIADADMTEVVGNCSTITHDGDRIVNWDMVEAYGYREEKRDYEASSPEDLCQKAAADLDPLSIGTSTANAIEVSAIDLHSVNPTVQPIRLLEWDHIFVRAYGLEDEDAELGVYGGGRLILDQWLPCSKLHISSVHPEDSWYRFGDLPQTLTRMSALRMGMLRRGNGTLVRRTDGTPWNTDRVWDHAQEAWDHADEIQDGLDDFKQTEDDRYAEVTAGLDDLLEQYGKMGGNIDDLKKYLNGEIDRIDHTQDGLIDDIEVAIKGAQRTFFGVCMDSASSSTKSVFVSVPGDTSGKYTFALQQGVVVTVRFQYANSASSPTLNVNGTGAIYIRTLGQLQGFWDAGSTLNFVYDGSYWQAASTAIYGSEMTIGNPGQANFHTDGNDFALRINQTDLIRGDWDGLQVGMDDHPHVWIHSSHVDVQHSAYTYLRFGLNDNGAPTVESPQGVWIEDSDGIANIGVNGSDIYLNGTVLHLSGKQLYLLDGLRPVVFRSVAVTCTGNDYLDISNYDLGVGAQGPSGYTWVVTNGDYVANPTVITGTSYRSSTGTLRIHFGSVATGRMRLNLVGFYSAVTATNEPPAPEGPEIFDSYEIPDDQEVV